MDNYIVRIYRLKKDNPRSVVGLVEKVGDEGNRAFTGLEELWEILNPSGKGAGRSVNKLLKGGNSEQ